MSKFVGKFRKEKDYRDDNDFSAKQRKKSHGDFKKLRNLKYDDFLGEYEEKLRLPQKTKHF